MRWKPAHETHAIERVGITLQFSEPAPAKAWIAILDDVTTRLPPLGFNNQRDLGPLPQPQVDPVRGKNVFFGQISVGLGGMVTMSGHPGDAKAFSVSSGGKVREEVFFHRHTISYWTIEYERWSSFLDRFRDVLGETLEKLSALVDIHVIKLEYWDRFVQDVSDVKPDYAEVLRENSPYLPSFGPKETNLWHSHVGHFADSPEDVRRLINLNVDIIDLPIEYVDEEGPKSKVGRSIGIYSMAQDASVTRHDMPTLAMNINQLDILHRLLKNVLESAITETAAARISLNIQG